MILEPGGVTLKGHSADPRGNIPGVGFIVTIYGHGACPEAALGVGQALAVFPYSLILP